MVVFSLQSVIKDPPFSRLDLVSCRNLMIYLNATLQKKMIPMFHYTLNTWWDFDVRHLRDPSENSLICFRRSTAKWKVFLRKEGLASGIIDYTIRGLLTQTTNGGLQARCPVKKYAAANQYPGPDRKGNTGWVRSFRLF